MRIGVGEIGMRTDLPRRFDDAARLLQVATLAEQPRREIGGGNQRRLKLHGFERQRTGSVRVRFPRR